MTEKERTNYETQTIKTCIQTYFNLYGVMPGTKDMIDWLGETYIKYIASCIPEHAAA